MFPLDRFYRLIFSVFPVIGGACGAPTDWCFELDHCGSIVELSFKMQPGYAFPLGKAHLKKIWDQIDAWDAMAFELLRRDYKGDAEDGLQFDTLWIYENGSFALGYTIIDDPDHLHWFIDFSKNFLPNPNVTSTTF